MTSRLPLATGNLRKLAVLQPYVGAWRLEAYDPLDVELSVEVGYEAGAIAKAEKIRSDYQLSFAIGHDSGFEFDSLGGEPGPRTHRWLDQKPDLSCIPIGSGVTVVHCVALALENGTVTWIARDRRIFKTSSAAPGSLLPLTSMVEGPERSLSRVLSQAISRLEAEMRDGAL